MNKGLNQRTVKIKAESLLQGKKHLRAFIPELHNVTQFMLPPPTTFPFLDRWGETAKRAIAHLSPPLAKSNQKGNKRKTSWTNAGLNYTWGWSKGGTWLAVFTLLHNKSHPHPNNNPPLLNPRKRKLLFFTLWLVQELPTNTDQLFLILNYYSNKDSTGSLQVELHAFWSWDHPSGLLHSIWRNICHTCMYMIWLGSWC